MRMNEDTHRSIKTRTVASTVVLLFSESHCRDSNLHYTQKRTNNHKVGDKSNSQSPDISEDDNYEIAERTLTTNDTTVTTELIISKTA